MPRIPSIVRKDSSRLCRIAAKPPGANIERKTAEEFRHENHGRSRIGCPGSRSDRGDENRVEVTMTLQLSRRGKEYRKTAQTLLHAARTMTDRAVAHQLKALADDYERRAEKASYVDAAKALARSAADAESEVFSEGDWA